MARIAVVLFSSAMLWLLVEYRPLKEAVLLIGVAGTIWYVTIQERLDRQGQILSRIIEDQEDDD